MDAEAGLARTAEGGFVGDAGGGDGSGGSRMWDFSYQL